MGKRYLFLSIGVTALISGCGSGDSAKGGGSSASAVDTIIDSVVEPAGENCAGGGIALLSGEDVDGDGVLSDAEVGNTEYICASADLIETLDLAVGDEECPTGGVKIVRGTDADGDGMLDAAEIVSESAVCQGGSANGSSDSGGCAIPARWDTEVNACVVDPDWSDTDLVGADLASSYLAGVDLSGSDLSGADLSYSSLRGADFTGADLTGANLNGADLSQANLTDVIAVGLVNCPFELPDGWACFDLGATGNTIIGPERDLSGLDLTGADLSDANLDGVKAVNLIGCPDDLPDGWECLELPQTGFTLVGPEANLSGLDLSSADLSGVDLRDANLDGANLTGADLTSSNLEGATVDGTNFSGTDLSQANLNDVDLEAAASLNGVRAVDLADCPDQLPDGWECLGDSNGDDVLIGPGADVSNVDFSGVDLSDIDLSGTNLSGADLSDADLGNVQMDGAILSGVDLSQADLNNVDMSGVASMSGVRAIDLQNCPDALPTDWSCLQDNNGDDVLVGPGADLVGVNLAEVDLSGMNLSGADLTDADLSNANLDDTDLSDAILTNASLESASTNSGTDFTGASFDNTVCVDGSNSDDNGDACP